MPCSTSCALAESCPSCWGLPRVWHLCSVVSVCSASLVKSLVSSLTALCVELLVRLFQAASFRCRARALSTSALAIDAAVASDHNSCASEAELAIMQVHEIPRHGHLHLPLHSPRHFLQLACLPLRACKCDQMDSSHRWMHALHDRQCPTLASHREGVAVPCRQMNSSGGNVSLLMMLAFSARCPAASRALVADVVPTS